MWTERTLFEYHIVYIPFGEIWPIEGKRLANHETSYIFDESKSIYRVANK